MSRETASHLPEDTISARARISLLDLGGVPGARIGAFVGQRLAVPANTSSRVLLDETEVDYAALLTRKPASR